MKVGFGRMHRVRLEGSLGGISFLFFSKLPEKIFVYDLVILICKGSFDDSGYVPCLPEKTGFSCSSVEYLLMSYLVH